MCIHYALAKDFANFWSFRLFSPDQIMQYVRSLEQRVKQLEDDKRTLTHKINQLAATTGDPSLAVPPDSGPGALTGRPEAVVRALQVLEVREQLEREQGRTGQENMSDTASADMDDGEKALVREMCNVSVVVVFFTNEVLVKKSVFKHISRYCSVFIYVICIFLITYTSIKTILLISNDLIEIAFRLWFLLLLVFKINFYAPYVDIRSCWTNHNTPLKALANSFNVN